MSNEVTNPHAPVDLKKNFTQQEVPALLKYLANFCANQFAFLFSGFSGGVGFFFFNYVFLKLEDI